MEVRLCTTETVLPFLGMVVVMLAQVGIMEFSKIAFSQGMNKYIFVVYSNALSTLILLPLSLVVVRSQHVRVTCSFVFRVFLLGLIGCGSQISGFAGIEDSNPTLGTAILNLIPAFTFLLAIIFRMEKIDWRSKSSQAKSIGTILSITGAFVVIFYKGPPVIQTLSLTVSYNENLFLPQLNWILGGLFFTSEAFFISAWYIAQSWILKEFPAVLILMFFYCLFCSIQSAIISLVVVKEASAWKLRLDMGLLAILYTAVVGTVVRTSLCTWCLKKTGPLFVAMFKPLAIIIAVALGIIFLEDDLHVGRKLVLNIALANLGSVVGSIIIVTGFYAMMLGKAEEEKKERSRSPNEEVPLLKNLEEET